MYDLILLSSDSYMVLRQNISLSDCKTEMFKYLKAHKYEIKHYKYWKSENNELLCDFGRPNLFSKFKVTILTKLGMIF